MKTRRIVFLNGPINSGKTTLGLILSRHLGNCCYLEGDTLVPQKNLSFEDWINLTINKAIDSGILLVLKGKLPVITFPLRKQDWRLISYICHDNDIQPICITLAPKIETVLSVRSKRLLMDWERKRIEEMYVDGYQAREFSNLIIKNDNESPETTASTIINFLFP